LKKEKVLDFSARKEGEVKQKTRIAGALCGEGGGKLPRLYYKEVHLVEGKNTDQDALSCIEENRKKVKERTPRNERLFFYWLRKSTTAS